MDLGCEEVAFGETLIGDFEFAAPFGIVAVVGAPRGREAEGERYCQETKWR